MRTVVVQKAAITNAHGEILLLRRSKTDIRRPLQWDLPGGLVDDGEDLIAGISREVKEETGLEAGGYFPVYAKTEVRTWKDHEGEHTDNVTFIFYRARATSYEVTLSYEHVGYTWTSIKKAILQTEYDLHKNALKYILENKLLA